MEERLQLEKNLKPSSVWALALGAIIGFGCFILPGDWIAQAGPMGVVLGFFFGGLMILVIGRSYGFMVRNFPVAGGEFAYSYQGFGRIHAFVCSWFLVLGYLAVVPMNATALPILFKFTSPELFSKGYLYSIAGWEVFSLEIAIAVGAILIFGVLNYRGVRVVGRIQLLMVILLLSSVALLAAGSFFKPGTEFGNLIPHFAIGKTPFASILSILAISTWAFAGFDTIPQASEEFGFSPKKAFRLIVLAILFGALMYIIVSLSTAVAIPRQDLVAKKLAWATGASMKSSMGNTGTNILLVGVLMAMFTGLNGFYLATSRLLFSMGRAKVLPPWFAKIHPKHKTPSNAIIFTLLISLIAPWFGRQVIIWILNMSAVGTALAYAYTCLAAFLLSRALPEERRATYHIVGFVFSLGFLTLLCVPGMPAFMAPPSWIALAVWTAMGITFFSLQAKQYRQLSNRELDYLILNKKKDK